MAIYTPRGLKIRIGVPYAFGIMTRLYPKVTPFKILKTTEGIESIPGMLAFIAGLIAFSIHLPPIQIALFVAAAQIVGALINAFRLFAIPGLIGLGTLFSYISGFGIYLTVVIIIGFVLGGWQAVAAFFAGKIISAIVNQVIEFWQTSRYRRLAGHPLTVTEVNFFNAYRLYASRIGVTTDIDLRDEEMQEEHWGTTFQYLAMEWPEVVRRFTSD